MIMQQLECQLLLNCFEEEEEKEEKKKQILGKGHSEWQRCYTLNTNCC